jgi:prepilin-type N-terminal cleavage/methylation domain-containing protein
MRKQRGFTLIELLVVITIIGVLATISVVGLVSAQHKARDAKRKFELAQIGRFLSGGPCYVPDAGPGDYDLAQFFGEVMAKNPQYAKMMAKMPRDPRGGNDTETGYRYVVSEDGKRCAFYGNLENAQEKVTITGTSVPTPGGGTGVFQGAEKGRNGTNRYFQASN